MAARVDRKIPLCFYPLMSVLEALAFSSVEMVGSCSCTLLPFEQQQLLVSQ